MADKNKMHEYYSRPVELGKWDGFKQFLWNGETSECLGRTGGSWGKCQAMRNPNFQRNFFSGSPYPSRLRNARRRKKHGGFLLYLESEKRVARKIDFRHQPV
jgi:Sodium / potassium ATPase beta chain